MSQAPALWTKHRNIAYAIARDFYLPGGEQQDLDQEALIGLWIASRGWEPGRGATFPTFAALVIRRRLQTVLRMALYGKHRPLDESLREVVNDEGERVSVTDTLPGGSDPADVVIFRETLDRLAAAIQTLSPLEREALLGVANGLTYAEIEGVADADSVKRVDNAISRARAKLREAA